MKKIQKSIVKNQVENYLNENLVKFTFNEREEYLLENNPIKEIDIDEYGFRVWSKEKINNDSYIQYFHILIEDYYIFSEMIEIKKLDYKSLDDIEEIIKTYDQEMLNNIVNKLEYLTNNIKKNFDYISKHDNPYDYLFKYGEHNHALYPSNIIDTFDTTIEFIQGQIRKIFN